MWDLQTLIYKNEEFEKKLKEDCPETEQPQCEHEFDSETGEIKVIREFSGN